jgi:CHAT domain-containing protein
VRVAEIYGQLGLTDLAYRQLERGLTLYGAAEAPSRVAGALMKLAHIERAQGEFIKAARWFARAARIYQLLGLPLERAEAELGRLENSLPLNAIAARTLLDTPQPALSALSAAEHARHTLLKARWLLQADAVPAARTLLLELAGAALNLQQRVDVQTLLAQITALSDAPAALVELQQAIVDVSDQARRSAGALGFLTLRQAHVLRERWTRIALQNPPTMDLWWAIARDSNPSQALVAGALTASSGSVKARVGSRLAEQMLAPDTSTSPAAESAMLSSLVAHVADTNSVRHVPDLQQLQQALPPDTWLLVVLPAEPQSAALWISGEHAQLQPIAGDRALQQGLSTLLQTLGERSRPSNEVHAAAAQWSAMLFSGAPQAEPPARLWVLADEPFRSAPLALLRWPGSAQELLESTATSWISAVEVRESLGADKHEVTAFMADFTDSDSSAAVPGLPPLWAAAYEPDWIRKALAPQPVQQVQHRDFSASALQHALATPGAWVHVASHGMAQTQRLGYAGVWLPATQAGAKPEFISWLDLIEHPLQAELVVLNACELAAAPHDARQANVSFASAISAAGIREVVAAHWVVGDTATALWVPQFYRSLREQADPDSAVALRAAQLALKHSRAFRHPYAWASLGHFRRIEILPEPR